MVHGNRGALEVGGHDPRQGLDCGARRAVGDEAAPDHRLVVHRDDHHPAAAFGEHARDHSTGDEERAGDLRVHDVAETLWRHLPEWLGLGEKVGVDRPHADPGVGDQEIHPAEAFVDIVDGRAHRLLVTDVESDTSSSGPELLGGRSRPSMVTARDDNLGSRLDERDGHRPPESTGRAGHERPRAGEVSHPSNRRHR
jgi:hypothetical protein